MIRVISVLRIFFIYLLILMPIIFTSILLNRTILNKEKRDLESEIVNQMQYCSEGFLRSFLDYKSKSVALIANSEFSKPLLRKDAYDIYNSIRFLSDMKLFDGRIHDLLVYYGEGDCFSSQGLVKPNNYFKILLGCDDDSVANGMNILSSKEDKILFLRTKNNRFYMVYHFYMGEHFVAGESFVQIILSDERLGDFLGETFQQEGLLARMSVDNKSIFFKPENGNKIRILPVDEAQDLMEEYVPIKQMSVMEDMGMELQLWYDNKIHLSEFYQIRNLNLVIIGVGISISIILSFAVSYSRAFHVKEILDNILQRKEVVCKKNIFRKNEYDYIQSALNNSIQEWNYAQGNLSNYRRMLLKQVAIMLFQGAMKDREELLAIIRTCGMELYEEYFYLYGINLEEVSDIERLENVLQYDLHFSKPEKKQIFLLCESSSWDYDGNRRMEMSIRLKSLLEDVGIDCIQIAISQVYDEISMANYAYLEVEDILESIKGKGQSVTIWEDWIQTNRKNKRIPTEKILLLQEALEKNENVQAENVLKNILSDCDNDEYSESKFYIRYMIMQTLLSSVRTHEKSYEYQKEITSIDIKNQETFQDKVIHIINSICEKEQKKDYLKFVEENYMYYSLSLEQIAEYVGVSIPQMSKLFKHETGVGYIEYVTRLRMEKTRELLEQTDLKVKEIFSMVGYIDAVNASKKFKSYYQMTPAVYRESVQKNKKI